ncbi:Ligase-associated DNA damage response DEXH box helicase [Rhodovastum atsumiense]|uniref:Ligase-associated DNA damage response DEXH box helicase n=1 Tax=Rhodovastum atsumiense TaxID=504468 RepID=A0A5M6IS57_9PROT|nr:ligase-associated DNA damage response DEXH box helicase [Rhodovastum atsumiense]KAA5611133.1 ligase-associated DNA damage response DEXH box helicase [Rhodovastum atsumiense]CAH2599201.1 Ligase-associated DNA damage response DEXH box helicase [Rhodovastum atsumiense]
MAGTLPEPFAAWFARQGWTPRPHQCEVLAAAQSGRDVLLIAPTGGGKTLAGFLPGLVALHAAPRPGLHTLYVSPLKALATDIARNLTRPIEEMDLPVSIGTRSGDTPAGRRRQQREHPPNLLLTTPESLALLLSLPDAPAQFAGLATIVIDEIHALAGSKRGDQLALGLARLGTLAPAATRIGLSATVAHRAALAAYVARDGNSAGVEVIAVTGGAPPRIGMILPRDHLPWSGHMGLAAAPEILARIRAAGMTIVFVNTRAQAELLFQELWKRNDETLPIAIHHGSLEPEQRQRVEQAMAAGRLRAVVATSSLDLGIDWGGIDQVLQVGAPKGVSRLLQRVGRANHRMDEPSSALLVPANRFEVLECEAAILGVAAQELDGEPPRPGGLDVLAQHVLGTACAGPFLPDALYAEIRRAAPYAALPRRDFDDVLGFVENGGYTLAAYDQYRRLFRDAEGRVHVTSERVARQHRMNIGTIVEEPLLQVRYAGRGGAALGEVEEYFANMLTPGDTFIFAGRLLRFLRLRETICEVIDGGSGDPRVPAYAGGRMPLTTNLADRVRALLQDPSGWAAFPAPVREWLALQKARSRLPGRDDLLVETFPRGDRWYLVAYCFEGRNAHQTLGMLLTRRMQRFGFAPLGFVATDYVLACWSAHEPHDIARLFEEDLLGDDLEAWMAESSMLRRTFRTVAVIAGLIERHHPGAGKNRRQVTVNSDLIYDVLRRHQPDHILLRATRADAAGGLTDIARIALLLRRVRGRIRHMVLSRVSPLAVPVLLEIGRENVRDDDADDALLEEAELVAEATGLAEPPPFRPRPARPRAGPARGDPRQGHLFG